MQIEVKFTTSKQEISVGFFANKREASVGFDHFQAITKAPEPEYYEGEYEATPKVTEQVLPTKQKLMADDLVVKAIPYFGTSNDSGGQTVYIGGEYEAATLEVSDDGLGNVAVKGAQATDDGLGNVRLLSPYGDSLEDLIHIT